MSPSPFAVVTISTMAVKSQYWIECLGFLMGILVTICLIDTFNTVIGRLFHINMTIVGSSSCLGWVSLVAFGF